MDDEVMLIANMHEALSELDRSAQQRVLEYLDLRLAADYRKIQEELRRSGELVDAMLRKDEF